MDKILDRLNELAPHHVHTMGGSLSLHGIELYQTSGNRFVVRYGEQLDEGLNYEIACDKLGQAIMHALTCDGEIKHAGWRKSEED
jgi:hypothetical protein